MSSQPAKQAADEDLHCYGFDDIHGLHPCTNQAVWFWRIDYDDPDIIGYAYCQVCDSCLRDLDNKHAWRKLGEETTGLIT